MFCTVRAFSVYYVNYPLVLLTTCTMYLDLPVDIKQKLCC